MLGVPKKLTWTTKSVVIFAKERKNSATFTASYLGVETAEKPKNYTFSLL